MGILVRFIVSSSDFIKVLSGRENEDFIVLRRDNGFFANKEAFTHRYPAIFYTDDETLLNYVPCVDGKYNIEFKFPGHDKFIPISELYPNLRSANNLTAMFQKGIFHRAFDQFMVNKQKFSYYELH